MMLVLIAAASGLLAWWCNEPKPWIIYWMVISVIAVYVAIFAYGAISYVIMTSR